MLSIKKTFGFSLIELLVAITIMAVMSGIALSSYQSSIIKSKRKAALSVLFQITAQQEEYFVNNKSYASSLLLLGYGVEGTTSAPFYINDNGDSSTSALGSYQIEISNTTNSAYSLSAIPINGQIKDSQCGTLTIASAGAKSINGTSDVIACFR